jgi:hypothetical protein
MVLNLLLASGLGFIVVPVEFSMLVFKSFSVTLFLWGLGAAWEVYFAAQEVWEEKADTDIIYAFVC